VASERGRESAASRPRLIKKKTKREGKRGKKGKEGGRRETPILRKEWQKFHSLGSLDEPSTNPLGKRGVREGQML